MAWVKFDQPYRWTPTRAVSVSYREGFAYNVTRACAKAAIDAGAAQRTAPPARERKGKMEQDHGAA